VPQFIAPIYARWRWDELHPLLQYASRTAAESLYHTFTAFDQVVRGAPPGWVLPYGSSGHYFTFAQLESLGHRFIASRFAYERVQRELTLAFATGPKATLPEAWSFTATSAHDLAIKVLQACSQMVMGWEPETPNTLFAQRWESLRRRLDEVGGVDGHALAEAMWLEATYADEKYRADLDAPLKLATSLLDLLQRERQETREFEAPRLETRGVFLCDGDVVRPTPRAVMEAERMEGEADETRRKIASDLRDGLRAAAADTADRLARPARDYSVTNWQEVLRFVGDWQADDAARAISVVRDLKALATAPPPPPVQSGKPQASSGTPAQPKPDSSPFDAGEWLMPPLPMSTIVGRLGPGYTDEKTKSLLKQFQLQNFPAENRQSWTVRLDLMPKDLRKKLVTPTDAEKKSQR
jgi:hypothetical protein